MKLSPIKAAIIIPILGVALVILLNYTIVKNNDVANTLYFGVLYLFPLISLISFYISLKYNEYWKEEHPKKVIVIYVLLSLLTLCSLTLVVIPLLFI